MYYWIRLMSVVVMCDQDSVRRVHIISMGKESNATASFFAIKDTMKEDRLGDYATEIEKYYESLIK